MRLPHQFQGQTVRGQGYRRVAAYRVGRTRWPHACFVLQSVCLLGLRLCYLNLFVCLSVRLTLAVLLSQN